MINTLKAFMLILIKEKYMMFEKHLYFNILNKLHRNQTLQLWPFA